MHYLLTYPSCHTVLHSCCHLEDKTRKEQMGESKRTGIRKAATCFQACNAEPAAVMEEEKVA